MDHIAGALPNFERIVFHPTGLRVNLPVFPLIGGDNLPGVVEEHTTGAGGTLVDGGNVLSHMHLS
jgi:hypothetical protein